MAPKKNKTPVRSKKAAKSGNFWPRAGHFDLNEPLENILGPNYLKKVNRFKSAFLEYIKNPEGANSKGIIELAIEAGMDLPPEKREKGDRSYYEMLLKGKKDKNHYFFLASDIFMWGHKAEAIDYLKIGISHVPEDQKPELVRLKDELEIMKRYIGADQSLAEYIYKAAKSDVDILIEGETGTGKEIVAHLIHDFSDRTQKTFIAISCAEISPQLIESELFGYKKGAFTGAISDKVGIIEAAENTTLFLDEINALKKYQQAKLLRCLQEREIRPVGGTTPKKINVRFLCATNQSASELVKEGKLRADLYYRIGAFTISLPPLCGRVDVIRELAQHFIKVYKNDKQKTISLTESALKLLQSYSWPGNIRELENLLRVIVSTIEGCEITPFHITAYLKSSEKGFQSLEKAVEKWWTEKELIKRYQDIVLGDCEGNISKASKILGHENSTLRRRLKNKQNEFEKI